MCTRHIHNWVLFLLWLHPFILSGVVSLLISNSILGTYEPGEFLFQYPIILPSHTVHGVLKARILKWFAIPFSSGPHSVRSLHRDPTVLGGSTWHSYSTFKVRRGGHEKIPLIQGKEQWLCFAGAAVKRYPTSKARETRVRW